MLSKSTDLQEHVRFPKPRNPTVVPLMQRKAGRHALSNKSLRQRLKRQISTLQDSLT